MTEKHYAHLAPSYVADAVRASPECRVTNIYRGTGGRKKLERDYPSLMVILSASGCRHL